MEAPDANGEYQDQEERFLPAWVTLTLSIFLLLGGSTFLCISSGGMPPVAWLLFWESASRLPQLWEVRGSEIILPFAFLAMYAFFILVAWLSLLLSGYNATVSAVHLLTEKRSTERLLETRPTPPLLQQATVTIKTEAPVGSLPPLQEQAQHDSPTVDKEEAVETPSLHVPTAPLENEATTPVDEDLAQLIAQNTTTLPDPAQLESSTRLLIGARSDAGHVRRHQLNEDRLFVQQWSAGFYELPAPNGLFVVAECSGHQSGGQEANKQIIQTLSDTFIPALMTDPGDAERLVQLLTQGIQDAIFTYHLNNAMLERVAVSCLLILGTQAYVVLLGDSRCYLYHAGNDRLQRVDTQAEGTTRGIRIVPVQPEQDETYLLCSDGLWTSLDEDLMQYLLRNYARNPANACQKLLDQALEGEGEDNISALIVHVAPNKAIRNTEDELAELFGDILH